MQKKGILIMVFGLLFQVGSATAQSNLFPGVYEADAILEMIQDKYVALAGDSIEVEVTWSGGMRDSWIEQTDPSQVSVFPVNLLVPGTQVVTVEIRDKDAKISRRHLNVKVNLKAELAFSKKVIKRGHKIEGEDLEVRSVELGTETIAGLACQPRKLLGMETSRCISPGSPVRWDHVTPPALVRKGETVECIFDTDTFTIRTQGTALESGAIGEEVWVKLEKNGKRIKATVIDRDQVSLQD